MEVSGGVNGRGIVFGIAVLGLIVVSFYLFVVRIPANAPSIHFNFVGFQNTTNGWEAILFVTNWPRSSTSWHSEEVSYHDGSRWRADKKNNRNLSLSIQNQTNITVAFRVPGTNVPVRIVTRLDSEAEGWWPQTWRQLVRALRLPYTARPGTVRWITNEITSVQVRGE